MGVPRPFSRLGTPELTTVSPPEVELLFVQETPRGDVPAQVPRDWGLSVGRGEVDPGRGGGSGWDPHPSPTTRV